MKLLLVGHDAARTGAPIVLLEYGRWLVAHGHQVQFLLARGGALEPDFAAVATTVVLPRWSHRRRAAGLRQRWLRSKYDGVDLVWVNTVTLGPLSADLAPLAPLVTHVHELDHWVNTHVPSTSFQAAVRSTSAWVAASQGVETMLVGRGVSSSQVHVVPEFGRVVSRDGEAVTRVPGVVGGSGTLDWRKGPDLFLQVARQARDRGEDTHFVWLGSGPDREATLRMEHDIRKADLHNVEVLPSRPDVRAFFDSISVFLLTSREDTFPLVMVEAASAGIPVVAFSGSGGADDFIGDSGGGSLVPYLDAGAMGDEVTRLLADDALRVELGSKGRAHAAAHHRPEDIAARFFLVAEQLLSPV